MGLGLTRTRSATQYFEREAALVEEVATKCWVSCIGWLDAAASLQGKDHRHAFFGKLDFNCVFALMPYEWVC